MLSATVFTVINQAWLLKRFGYCVLREGGPKLLFKHSHIPQDVTGLIVVKDLCKAMTDDHFSKAKWWIYHLTLYDITKIISPICKLAGGEAERKAVEDEIYGCL